MPRTISKAELDKLLAGGSSISTSQLSKLEAGGARVNKPESKEEDTAPSEAEWDADYALQISEDVREETTVLTRRVDMAKAAADHALEVIRQHEDDTELHHSHMDVVEVPHCNKHLDLVVERGTNQLIDRMILVDENDRPEAELVFDRDDDMLVDRIRLNPYPSL